MTVTVRRRFELQRDTRYLASLVTAPRDEPVGEVRWYAGGSCSGENPRGGLGELSVFTVLSEQKRCVEEE